MRWLLFLLPFSLFSAPIGNPSAPALLEEGIAIPDTSWANFQAGFTQDFLLEKLFRPAHTSPTQEVHKASLSGNAELAEITWSIKERLNVQLLLGPGNFDWSWIQPQGRVEGESNTGFFSAANGTIILLEVKDTTLSAEGQVGAWTGAKADISLNGVAQKPQAKNYFYYWQAGAALTQKIGPLAPYIGCNVNQTTFRAKRLSTGAVRLRSLLIVGPFAGCTISTGTIASFNLEWRGWFEEAISLSCQLRF
jgi:hypothetical protein